MAGAHLPAPGPCTQELVSKMGAIKGSRILLPAALAITSFHTLKAMVDLNLPQETSGPVIASEHLLLVCLFSPQMLPYS